MHGLFVPDARLEQLEIVLHVGIAGVLRLRSEENFARAGTLAPQHVRISPVVQDFGAGATKLPGALVGLVGKIKPAHLVMAGGKPQPSLDVAGIAFGHATEVTLGSREVPTAEVFLGETEIALGAVARRWRCNGTRLNRTGRSQTAGRGRIIVRWRRAFLGRTAIRIQEIAEIGRSSAAGEHEQAGKCDKVSTRSRSHRCIPRRIKPSLQPGQAKTRDARNNRKPARSP